jgi:hypothetical protein
MMKKLAFVILSATASIVSAQYTATILPTPNGTGRAAAAGGGQIVGVAFGSGGGPALWNGVAHTFGVLSTTGYSNVELRGVGGQQQVGWGSVGNQTHALAWAGTGQPPIDLHNTAFPSTIALATDGVTQVGAGSPLIGIGSRAVLWQGSAQSIVSLHPAGYENSEAAGVWGNVQVGSVSGGPGGGAVLWRGSAQSMQLLPGPKGIKTAGASAIHGDLIVGTLDGASSIVWDANTLSFSLLGPGRALDTNAEHQVGYAGSAFEERALRWSGTEASRLDLHQFLPGNVASSIALGIDENGIIAGWGNINGFGQVPIVWTPVAEPGTCLFLSLGTVILILRKEK